MILINLLPPELRKRKVQLQFNPLFAALAACLVVDLLMLGGFFWVKHRKQVAEETLSEQQGILAQKTQEAQVVTAMEAEINKYKLRRDYILSLLNRKVFWAKTIDDFSSFLTQEWDGFSVCAQSLTIADRGVTKGRKGEPDLVTYGFSWRYKLVGLESQKSGTYIHTMFARMQDSDFWSEYGFLGKPEDRYFGDRPRENDTIKRVIIEGDLDWQRLKIAAPDADESKGGR
jgi:hypothetical protein